RQEGHGSLGLRAEPMCIRHDVISMLTGLARRAATCSAMAANELPHQRVATLRDVGQIALCRSAFDNLYRLDERHEGKLHGSTFFLDFALELEQPLDAEGDLTASLLQEVLDVRRLDAQPNLRGGLGPMMVLYQFWQSSSSWRIRWAIRIKGV